MVIARGTGSIAEPRHDVVALKVKADCLELLGTPTTLGTPGMFEHVTTPADGVVANGELASARATRSLETDVLGDVVPVIVVEALTAGGAAP
jgi:hypothetical protein